MVEREIDEKKKKGEKRERRGRKGRRERREREGRYRGRVNERKTEWRILDSRRRQD